MISLIIPVFNGEQTLIRCLASILRQSFRDFELILVDNGSTDASLSILRRFEKQYRRQRRISVLQEPCRGIAHARNTGMANAGGAFLAFVDQDDIIDSRYLETLYNVAMRRNADIVISGYYKDSPDGKRRRCVRLHDAGWSRYMNIAPWGKLFRTELIRQNSLFFLDVLKGEDVFFVLHAYNESKRTIVTDYVGYHWIQAKNSLSHTRHREISKQSDILPLFQKLQDSLYPLKHVTGGELEYFLIKTMSYDVLQCGRSKKAASVKKYYRRISAWIDRYYPDNKHNPYVSVKKPKGELLSVRFIVWLLENMRRYGYADAFLSFYCRLPLRLREAWI